MTCQALLDRSWNNHTLDHAIVVAPCFENDCMEAQLAACRARELSWRGMTAAVWIGVRSGERALNIQVIGTTEDPTVS